MEDMEIDQIVDVPDTPDRLTTRHDDRKYVGNPDVVDVMYTNEKRERGFPAANIAKNRRLAFHPLENSIANSDEMNNCSNYITVSPSEKSYPSQNAPIFRRAQTDKVFQYGTTDSNGVEKMEKGKTISSEFSSKSSHHGPISVLDLTEENGQSQQLKSAFSHHGSKDNATKDKKELKASVGNSSSPFIADSSNNSSNTFSEQYKIDNKTLPSPNVSFDRGKRIAQSNDSQYQLKTEKQVFLPRLSTAPRARGQKRLVRNGCISPHNIATRAKQSAEQYRHEINDVEQSHLGHSVSTNTMSQISVDDIVAEGSDRVKGKEVLIHPSSSGHNARTIDTASSSPVINYEETNGSDTAIRNSRKYSGGQGGWRTAHNHKNTDHHLYDVNGHHLRRNDDVGRFISGQYMNRMNRRESGRSQSSKDVHGSLLDHAAQATSRIIPEVGQSTGTRRTADTLTKRQRKRGSTSRNPDEASYNSEIVFLGSSGESSISSSSRSPVLDPEGVELLPETRCTNGVPQDLDDINNNNSNARARQVEADEILARELQEQLYHEDSFEGGEVDEHLAWELQHEEDLLHTSVDSHHISHPTWLPRAPSSRQPGSRSHQNPSNRRRAVPQVPVSNRMSQLRSRILSRSATPIISTGGRRPQFPLDMDLDMRLDILEILEDTVGELTDMGVPDGIIHAQRDFNEDDYEMLLALDEGNHQHTGASANQINSLPQSTIQTDNFIEACAICLEIPVKGEIIRHLPCLHKFHKECIDPWLRRKTSCPVCKSSIT